MFSVDGKKFVRVNPGSEDICYKEIDKFYKAFTADCKLFVPPSLKTCTIFTMMFWDGAIVDKYTCVSCPTELKSITNKKIYLCRHCFRVSCTGCITNNDYKCPCLS